MKIELMYVIFAVLLILEMATMSFYLLIIGLGFLFTGLMLHAYKFVVGDFAPIFMYILLLVNIGLSYFLINANKHRFYFFNLNKNKNINFNFDIDQEVMIDSSSFLMNQKLFKVEYKGVKWFAKMADESEIEEVLSLIRKQIKTQPIPAKIKNTDKNILMISTK